MRVLVILAVVLCCDAVQAQAQGGQQPTEFVDQYNEMFINRPPLVGSVLANVTAWDAEGKPFELNSTRGKHTVIVFGCLT